jgi:glycosyltransferase involved in cell wall biosynthesis
LFSVIVPTYNRADVLPRAIKSVLEQSFRDLELLVVDDGSDDDIAGVVEQFDDRRLRYMSESHCGVSAARNAGAAAAQGEWLVFLDNDDELVPDALSLLGGVAASERTLLVGGVTRVAAANGHLVVLPDPQLVLAKRFTPLLAGAFAIRKAAFDEIGGYDAALGYSENTELAWRLRSCLSADSIAVIEAPLVRVHTQPARGHERVRYEAARLILSRRSYEMESDGNPRANREFRGNYLCIAATGAAELGRRSEALRLVARAIVAEPFRRARYRSAAGVVKRIVHSRRGPSQS